MSIKCFINGTSTAAVSTACPTTTPASAICARLSLKSANFVRAYSCVPEATVTAATGFPTVTGSLVCKNITLAEVVTEYCFCNTENCNDPAKGATTAVDLKVSGVDFNSI